MKELDELRQQVRDLEVKVSNLESKSSEIDIATSFTKQRGLLLEKYLFSRNTKREALIPHINAIVDYFYKERKRRDKNAVSIKTPN